MRAKDRMTCGVFSPGPRRGSGDGTTGRQSATLVWPCAKSLRARFAASGRFLVAAALCLLAGAMGWAQSGPAKWIVDDVIVRGNTTIPTAKIMGFIRTHPGGEYSKTEVDEDVRRLVESRLLRTVNVYKSEMANNRVV